jgi:LytS/YehU family sensor histidine kinase
MMLQSLVENSIKHGLEPKSEGGSLTISADIANGKLRVTVADTGLGFAVAGQPGTGVGLANVRERLAALYGGAARLAIEANAPTGTIVTIEVPYSFEADAPLVNGGAAPQPA